MRVLGKNHRSLLKYGGNGVVINNTAHKYSAYFGNRNQLIGRSVEMEKVYAILDRIGSSDVRVLIQGESGTGKERVARLLHARGERAEKPFITVDCGALPASLLESELFGYVKGAFTGANRDYAGLFEQADGGTLFLDEVTNMSLRAQARFLRVLQSGEIRRLGSSRFKHIDVRIISASNVRIPALVQSGEFRRDLYYRLNIVPIELPPLRARGEDVLLLASHFLENFGLRHGKYFDGISTNTMNKLMLHSWPGNVRELENAIERAVVLCRDEWLTTDDFVFAEESLLDQQEALFEPGPLQEAVLEFKRKFVSAVLERTGGNQTRAAKILQIQRPYLNQMIKHLGIRAN